VIAHTRPVPAGPGSTGHRGRLAVVADPVLSAADERLGLPAAGTEPSARLARMDPIERGDGLRIRAGGTSFERLPATSIEARALLDMVPPGSGLAALGPDATKELVLSGRLRGYSIVHFATHGQLHEVHPELSGLVLSLVDHQGRPIDGFLREHEVFSLSLPCDLVVLSACETALGPEISGEGIAGITRGFMHAGAHQVMVSLWQVADRGTAELMEQLYDAMLGDGLTPPAALRRAQMAMWDHGRGPRSAPYFWAGFVVQGGFWDGRATDPSDSHK
jgi:CHAT domain-containing protein